MVELEGIDDIKNRLQKRGQNCCIVFPSEKWFNSDRSTAFGFGGSHMMYLYLIYISGIRGDKWY